MCFIENNYSTVVQWQVIRNHVNDFFQSCVLSLDSEQRLQIKGYWNVSDFLWNIHACTSDTMQYNTIQ